MHPGVRETQVAESPYQLFGVVCRSSAPRAPNVPHRVNYTVEVAQYNIWDRIRQTVVKFPDPETVVKFPVSVLVTKEYTFTNRYFRPSMKTSKSNMRPSGPKMQCDL